MITPDERIVQIKSEYRQKTINRLHLLPSNPIFYCLVKGEINETYMKEAHQLKTILQSYINQLEGVK